MKPTSSEFRLFEERAAREFEAFCSFFESDGASLQYPLTEMSPESREALLARYREYVQAEKGAIMSKTLELTPDSPLINEQDLVGVDEVVISHGYGERLEANIRFANKHRRVVRATTREAQKFASVVFTGA